MGGIGAAPGIGGGADLRGGALQISPFLKWVGSKRALAPLVAGELLRAGAERYLEPFLGSGAVALALRGAGFPARGMVLGDAQADLAETWGAVLAEPAAVAEALDDLAAAELRGGAGRRRRFFEATRARLNRAHRQGALLPRPEIAAAFIYLNRRGFNGLCRVNGRGDLNTPWGKEYQAAARLPTGGELRAVAGALAGAELLRAGDFGPAVARAGRGWVIYADPPYDGTFAGYAGGFDAGAQERLAGELRAAWERGAGVVASNADTPRIRSLYAGWAELVEVGVGCRVGGRGTRRKTRAELLAVAAPRPVGLRLVVG